MATYKAACNNYGVPAPTKRTSYLRHTRVLLYALLRTVRVRVGKDVRGTAGATTHRNGWWYNGSHMVLCRMPVRYSGFPGSGWYYFSDDNVDNYSWNDGVHVVFS